MKPLAPRFPLLLLPALLVAAVASGCATRHHINVDAITRVNAINEELTSFRIESHDRQTEADRLRHQETVRHIKTILSSRGLYEAPPRVEPHLIVVIDYGMAAPEVRYERVVEPIFASVPLERPTEDLATRRAARLPQATRQVIGHREIVEKVVVREKHLSISGRENKPVIEGRPGNEIFHIYVSIENESADLRSHLPILASAAMDKLGQTTAGIVATTLREDDETIAFVKRGL